MQPEVRERLITGLAQYLSAEAAGSSRFAVADGYLAVDNYFTALLLDAGIDPTRNHKRKLELAFQHFSQVFVDAQATRDEVELFYEAWQETRYSATLPTPGQTIHYIRLAYRLLSEITNYLAARDGETKEALEEDLYTEVVGSRWATFEEQVSHVHDAVQQEIEDMGDRGIGPKLTNKILNTSNFCDVRVLSDDATTKQIVSTDPFFGKEVGEIYAKFLRLVD